MVPQAFGEYRIVRPLFISDSPSGFVHVTFYLFGSSGSKDEQNNWLFLAESPLLFVSTAQAETIIKLKWSFIRMRLWVNIRDETE